MAGARGARHLPARLDRDPQGRRFPDPGLLSRAVAGLGDAAADDWIYLLLSAVGHDSHARAGLRPDPWRARPAALGVVGLCRGRIARLCRDAADLGGDARDVDANLPAADDLSELDLRPGALGANGYG